MTEKTPQTLNPGHQTPTNFHFGFQNHGYIGYGDSDNDEEHHIYEEISPQYSTTEHGKQSTVGIKFAKCIAAAGSGTGKRGRKSRSASRDSGPTVGCGTGLFDLLQLSARRVAVASSSSGVTKVTGSQSGIKCNEVDQCRRRVDRLRESTEPEVDEPSDARRCRSAINDLYYGQRIINYYDNQDDVIERPTYWSEVTPTLETRNSDNGDIQSRPPPEVPTCNYQHYIRRGMDRRQRKEHRCGCTRCICRNHKCGSVTCRNIEPSTATPTYVNYEVDLDAVIPRSSRRQLKSLFTSSSSQKCNRHHMSCQSTEPAITTNNRTARSSTGGVTTKCDDRCYRRQPIANADADADASNTNIRHGNYINWPSSSSTVLRRLRRVGTVNHGQSSVPIVGTVNHGQSSVPIKDFESESRTQLTNNRKPHFVTTVRKQSIDDEVTVNRTIEKEVSVVSGKQRKCSGRCELIPSFIPPDANTRMHTNGSEERPSSSTFITDGDTPSSVDRRRYYRHHLTDDNNNDHYIDNDLLIRSGFSSRRHRVRSDSRVKVTRCHCHLLDDLQSPTRLDGLHLRTKRDDEFKARRRVVQVDNCKPCVKRVPTNISTESQRNHLDDFLVTSDDEDVFLRPRRDLSSLLTMKFVRSLRRPASSTAIVTGLAVVRRSSFKSEEVRKSRHRGGRMEPVSGSSPDTERDPPGWRRRRRKSRSEVLVVVDMKSAQVLDVVTGKTLRTIGKNEDSFTDLGKDGGSKSWLREPMAICVVSNRGNESHRLAFVDRADQTVKVGYGMSCGISYVKHVTLNHSSSRTFSTSSIFISPISFDFFVTAIFYDHTSKVPKL